MKKTILKKMYPVQYLYPNNTDVYQYIEDYYIIFEGTIDGTNICFYNRNKSVLKKTTDAGKTFEEKIEFENPSFFVTIDYNLDDILDKVISREDGLIEELVI